MNVKQKHITWSKWKAWRIRLSHWEYWPTDVLYAPVYVWIFLLACRSRSWYFYTATNPGIEFGGLFGESKIKLLDQIPVDQKATTCFLPQGIAFDEIEQRMMLQGIAYPCIVKPNVGEGGLLVKKVHTPEELKQYVAQVPVDLLIQEFVSSPCEYSVLHFLAGQHNSISSITGKEFMQVTGNGHDNLGQLILQNSRTYLQFPNLKQSTLDLKYTPEAGEKITLSNIGNHRLGTKFLDGNHLYSAELHKCIEAITQGIAGAHFVRYDLKCTSPEDFQQGKNIKIVEVNGVGAEPAHIYDPKHSIFYAWKTLFKHWYAAYAIARINRKNGNSAYSFAEGRAWNKHLKVYRQKTRPLHES